MFRFFEGEIVALKEDYISLELSIGDTGVIRWLYNTTPPSYEVNFEGKDGRNFDMTMSEDELTAIPVPRKLTASSV